MINFESTKRLEFRSEQSKTTKFSNRQTIIDIYHLDKCHDPKRHMITVLASEVRLFRRCHAALRFSLFFQRRIDQRSMEKNSLCF